MMNNEAVTLLRESGFLQESKELDDWRDTNGNNWGGMTITFRREKIWHDQINVY